jgi:hypothetical protein
MSDQRDQYRQHNAPRRGSSVYANQGTGDQIIHTTPPRRGMGGDTKALLVTLVVDGVFFVYGVVAYTGGRNAHADEWRAGAFIALVIVTGGMIRRWLRRHM